MWIVFAFVSASIVGVRDLFKKRALQGNDILQVLCLVALFSAVLFVPFIILSRMGVVPDSTFFYVPQSTPLLHLCSLVKCLLLIACWLCSYDGIKHLPLTVSGMVAAFGPVMTVVGAMLVYGESLNVWQWSGVLVSTCSLVLICRGGDVGDGSYLRDRHFWLMLLSTFFSAVAALWDKFAMGRPEGGGLGQSVMFVQSWYNIYQTAFLVVLVLVSRRGSQACGTHRLPARCVAGVFMVAVCEVAADLLYDAALQLPGCLVSVLAMSRRGSVVVSFALGALLLGERDLKRKSIDLLLVLLGMVLLFFGS